MKIEQHAGDMGPGGQLDGIHALGRCPEGDVVAGSLNDAIEAVDVWTFSRRVGAADPDWLLDETDAG